MEKENEKTNVCPKCGAAVKEDDAFCGNCGYALKKSDVCPVCGQPMNGGNFCSKCGYSAKQSVTGLKKNTVDTVKKKIVSFAQSAWKFIKSHKKAVIAVLIIIALTVAIVPTAVFLASPFRKGKVDKIELGSTTKEEAKKLLGDPYIQTTTTELVVENGLESIEVLRQYSFGGEELWIYYENTVKNKLEKINKEIEKANSFEELERLDKKYESFFEKPFKSIVLAFDEDGKVSFVCFNKKTKYDMYDYFASTETKVVKSVELSKITVGINSYLAENNITYKAVFKDGSIIKSYLFDYEGYDAKKTGIQEIRFQDGWGEYKQRVEVKEVNVTVECDISDIQVAGAGYYEAGEEVTVTVKNYDSDIYKFIGWVKDGAIISTENPYTFKYDEAVKIKAIFEKDLIYDENGTTVTGLAKSGLTKVVIPKNVTGIEKEALLSSSLQSIKVADDNAYFCSEEGVLFNKTKTHLIRYPAGKTDGVYTIPSSVTEIESDAFSGCSFLKKITIPDSVSRIGENAFLNCSIVTATIPAIACSFVKNSALKTVVITSGEIANDSFKNFGGLTSVTFGNGVTSIGDYAFYNCTGLTNITIPDSVTSIGEGAFINCGGLTSITVDSNNKAYSGIGNCLIHNESKELILGCQDSIIPDDGSVTSIGEKAFSGCWNLTNITIPDGVTSIGSYAFSGCTRLTSITIPDSVTSIGESTFNGCSIKTAIIPTIACFYISNISLETVVITSGESIGDQSFVGCWDLTNITISDSVTSIGRSAFSCTGLTSITIPDSVTSIGRSAFSCTGLTSITIPDSVTSIGDYAFDRCSALTSITIGNGVTSIGGAAFYGCTGLTSITIPDSVTSIGGAAFYGCTGLTSITIPDSVTSIGGAAFSDCTGLTSITIGNGVTSIQNNVFNNCPLETAVFPTTIISYMPKTTLEAIIISSGTSIGDNAFKDWTKLTNVTIGDSVTSIGEGAFSGCSSLESITVPFVGAQAGKTSSDTYQYPFGYIFGESSYTFGKPTIQDYYGSSTTKTTRTTYRIPSSLRNVTVTGGNILRGAFYNCSMLTGIAIPDTLTSIEGYAFYDCSGITSITIPDSVTNMGSHAFSGCTGLTNITIPDSVTSIGERAFSGCPIETATISAMMCSSINNRALKTVVITSGNSITDSVFKNCTTLTKITMPDSVTSIGSSAFYGCTGLMSITIPDSVTSIGSSAFYGCIGLTTVTIGESVTSIGNSAFSQCYHLVEVYNKSSLMNIRYKGDLQHYVKAVYREPYISKLSIDENGYILYKDGEEISLIGYMGTDTVLTLPESITEINQGAFYDNRLITNVTIPDGVTSIGEVAFYCCTGLTSITIGNGVTSIGEHTFYHCNGLTSITVDSNNRVYSGTGNCLLCNESKKLILGCQNSIIPDDGSVTGIGEKAFYYCAGLMSITIPNSVTSIGSEAFQGCRDLASVKIGSSVTSIEVVAFSGCSNLKDIIFDGTMEQWNAIAKGDYWDSNTGSYVVHCTDGDIEK